MRVVVHVRWCPDVDPDVSEDEIDAQWAEILGPTFERARALGGRVIGWDQRGLTVDFAWDGLYDAVDFLVDAPLAPTFAAAMSYGAVRTVIEVGRAAIGLGSCVRVTQQLVELAMPGEVLISAELAAAADGQLGLVGEVGVRPNRPRLEAYILDTHLPFLTSDGQPPHSSGGFQLMNSSPAAARPSSNSPESFVERQVERLAMSAEVMARSDGSVFPPEVSSALRRRDADSLQALAKAARDHDAPEAADRLEAIAELAEGKSGEALRKLRRAKEKAQRDDPSARCRAALALGLALAAAGRPYEAALEGIEAVARAREGNDDRGQRACARFLSQVAAQLGDSDAARDWAQLSG
jgi:hypothetical protein